MKTNPLEPLYYSLEIPTLAMFSPRSKKMSNKMNEIREIKHIMNTIKSYILKDKLGIKDTPIYKVVTEIDYDYFHSDHDILGDAKLTTELVKLDEALIKEEKKYPN